MQTYEVISENIAPKEMSIQSPEKSAGSLQRRKVDPIKEKTICTKTTLNVIKLAIAFAAGATVWIYYNEIENLTFTGKLVAVGAVFLPKIFDLYIDNVVIPKLEK
jgi:hypothetical protein